MKKYKFFSSLSVKAYKNIFGFGELKQSFTLQEAEDSGIFTEKLLDRLAAARDSTEIILRVHRGRTLLGIRVQDLQERRSKKNKIKKIKKEMKEMLKLYSVQQWIKLNTELKRLEG